MNEALKYRAFLSYSNKDARWARWLHSSLEHFTIDRELHHRLTELGVEPPALRPIFRDRDDFSAGPTLTDQTINALDQSYALIVLCTQSAARSLYVNEEIRLFKWRHPTRPVIPVIAEKTPGGLVHNCFPQALQFRVNGEGQITSEIEELRLAADLRAEEGDGKDIGLAKVIAGLLGVPLDDVVRRAEREKRRRLKNWMFGLGVITALTLALATWAEINRREAVEQRRFAEDSLHRIARLSNELVGDWAERLQDQDNIPYAFVIDLLRKAEALVDGLSAQGAADPDVERSLGVALVELSSKLLSERRPQEARDTASKAVTIFERLQMAEPAELDRQSDLIAALDRQGDVLAASGAGTAVALNTFDRSLVLARELNRRSLDNPLYQRLLAVALEKRGDMVRDTNRSEAINLYRESLAIREKLARAEPLKASAKWEVAVSLDHIAAVERADSRLDEAVATWQKSLAITEEAQALEPTNHNLRREVAVAYQRIGDAEKARGALGAALDAYNSDLKIMRGLTASDHTRLGWAQDLLNSLFRVGDSLVANSEFEQALGIYEEGLGAAQQLCRQAIEQPDRRAVAAFYHQLSETLIKMRRYESAVERARQATAFFREVFRTHAEQRERLSQTLGNDAWYQLLAGHPSEALATAEEAIGLSPDFLALRVNKLHALVLTGRSAAAAAYYSASQAMEASGQPHLADMLLADLAEFRKSGISETDVQSIVEAFQLPQP